MLGIFTGMKITFRHFFGRKVTRLYPYEKREMPPRMRGLIHYLRDDQGTYKCEGCLLCEKICPPQAITVTYRGRDAHRDRPQTLPQAVWGNFRRSRKSLLSNQGRPERASEQLQPAPGEREADWAKIGAVLSRSEQPGAGLTAALSELQAAVGYLPRHAVERLSVESGLDPSTVYGVATATGLRAGPKAPRTITVCQCPACRSAGAKDLATVVDAELAKPPSGGAQSRASSKSARCLGDVRQAPVLVVGGQAHGDMSPDRARQIVREYLAAGGSAR